MTRRVKISASIICANWMNLKKDLQFLEQGGINYLHYDVMDGFFCPDYCLGSQLINIIRENTVLASDYHLMVDEPIKMLKNFTAKNGDIFTVHYEACKNLHRDIMQIKNAGFRVGVALNPATPITALECIIKDLDIVQVMTVNPGVAGQRLVESSMQKIGILDLWRNRDGLAFEIITDGNVSFDNIPKMISAGSDILVGGSSGLFIKNVPLLESIKNLKKLIGEDAYHAAYLGY